MDGGVLLGAVDAALLEPEAKRQAGQEDSPADSKPQPGNDHDFSALISATSAGVTTLPVTGFMAALTVTAWLVWKSRR